MTIKLTEAGSKILASVYSANLTGRTAVLGNGAAVRKLERDGLVAKATDGHWNLTVDGLDAYCEATGTHHVSVTPVDMGNGDTVYRAACVHGWETGFHYSPQDATDVAIGHGSVDRPLYVKPVRPVIDAQPEIEQREQAAREQFRALTLTDVLPVYGRTDGDVTRRVSSTEVKPGMWNCCAERPAYAMEMTDFGGELSWYGVCEGDSYTVEASRLAEIVTFTEQPELMDRIAALATPAVEDIAQPFRTRSKVKSTRAARRFRKGA